MLESIARQKKFILCYRAALNIGLSREEFGTIVGMQPQSVARKRLKIKDRLGTDLEPLPMNNNFVVSPERKDEFRKEFENLKSSTKSQKSKKIDSTSETYVITAAQNATPIHSGFLDSILTFCDHNDGELLVIPYRYRNPTSLWTDGEYDWWHQDVVKYMVDENISLCDRLKVMGHIKMQPTAVNPLSGFDSYTGVSSGIFGHPKVQLKTIPTPSKSFPKILSTTGAVTIPNYSDSKAGHKGEFHHSLSAVVIEIEADGTFHIRHIHGDDNTGEFYDLDKYYTSTDVKLNQSVSALVTGDTHIEFLDTDVDKATYTNPDSIVQTLNPEYIIYHDLQDFYARNHHHRGNDVLSIGKHRFGRNNVEEGLQLAADFIDRNSQYGAKNVIVKSNHDEALDRWLREADPKSDHENAQFYYYMKYHQVKNIEMNTTGFNSIDPFAFWCEYPESYTGLKSISNTVFLSRDESFSVNDIELGFHGDAGPNGSRGSINSMKKIGPKIVIGHSHTPGIMEGVYQVGLSGRLDLEYASGPSSWMNTHCVLYNDGSRTLLNVVNGKWHKS